MRICWCCLRSMCSDVAGGFWVGFFLFLFLSRGVVWLLFLLFCCWFLFLTNLAGLEGNYILGNYLINTYGFDVCVCICTYTNINTLLMNLLLEVTKKSGNSFYVLAFLGTLAFFLPQLSPLLFSPHTHILSIPRRVIYAV